MNVLNLVPRCWRSRWPFRRWFWQQEEIDRIWKRAYERRHALGLDDFDIMNKQD